MTEQEASKIIYKEWQKFLEHNIDYAGISEAYKMAIKALEQQPLIEKFKELDDWDKIARILAMALEQPKDGDTISRQAAINCIEGKIKLPYDTDTGELWKYLQGVVNAIEQLPSVSQPKERKNK